MLHGYTARTRLLGYSATRLLGFVVTWLRRGAAFLPPHKEEVGKLIEESNKQYNHVKAQG